MKQPEKFILENRGQIDFYEPSERIWDKLKNNLPQNPHSSVLIWKIAAVVFFITSIYFGTSALYSGASDKMAIGEFINTEDFYFSQIQERSQLLAQVDGDQAIINFQELIQLEAMYEVLRNQWQEQPEEYLEEAMKLNLITRLNLLNNNLQSVSSNNQTIRKTPQEFMQ